MCDDPVIRPTLPLLDQDPVVLALYGLSSAEGSVPARDPERDEAGLPSDVSVNLTRLLRLYDEGACPEEDVADARCATSER